MSASDADGDREAADPAATFDAVVAHLDAWEPGEGSNRTAAQRLQSFLDRRLNAGSDSVWDRDVVERRRGSAAADITVNGEIGVTLVDEVRPKTVADVRVALSLLAEQYNFVAVYWLDATPETADYRRSVERGASAGRLGVDGLRFVAADAGPSTAVGEVGVPGPRVRDVVAVGSLAALGAGLVGYTIAQTGGLGRLLLVGTVVLFVGTLALGTFVATH